MHPVSPPVPASPARRPLPALAAVPADVTSLADYERRAEAHLPPASWRHLQGGADQGVTLRGNRAAFERLRLMPRALADLRGGHTQQTLLGQRHASPILLAPLAYHQLAHPEGERATVRAAMALCTGMVASTLSSVTLEDIAGAARAAAAELRTELAPLWFQLYFQPERAWTLALVRRAEAAGYQAIVFTVDASVKRAGFALPPGVEAANLRGMPQRAQGPGSLTGPILFGTPLIAAAPTWADLDWLRAETRLPIVVKGLMSPDDVRMAAARGADAVVVSNHGGRVLDGLPSPLEALPRIARAVDGRLPLLLDGGVRTGTDVVKALALGAQAVLVGRPQLHALAVAGLPGVAHALHLLRAELELAMAQLGCRTLADITPGVIWRGGD